MSLAQSYLTLPHLGDVQWLCLVTLFVASVVTVLLYVAQCLAGHGGRAGHTGGHGEASELLRWALSLRGWRSQWQTAWLTAINTEARLPGSSVRLVFEEDGPQSSALELSQVCSFSKSADVKNVVCRVAGDKLQFSLCVSPIVPSTSTVKYSVKISPLQLQLNLQMHEAAGEVQVSWALSQLEMWDLQLIPSYTQNGAAYPSVEAIRDRVRHILCAARPTVLLSCQPSQGCELKHGAPMKVSLASSPPKPPRAHEWKLLVKNIRVTLKQEDGAAGSTNPYCLLKLDDPPQQLSSSVLKNASSLSWEQPFIFELSGCAKELNIQLFDEGKPQESLLLGEVSVPFDLVKKQPKGLQTFALHNKGQVIGSLSSEFTYLEPSEVRSWQVPTPAPAKKIEMDRTVMPCGTVVTTITAVKSKPGRAPSSVSIAESPLKPSAKSKLSERRVSEQASLSGSTVSKALSSSDTELLMLNGTDPVAEAAIRQLHESAKQKLKSPVKKSTIIISGVAKAPMSEDEEMALMAGYAASMDASMNGTSHDVSMSSETFMASVTGASTKDLSEPIEGPSRASVAEDWERLSAHDEDIDKKSALSLCISESGSKKGKGSFLHRSAKLFFRRRHQRKDPGLSQSHNDLVYVEHPTIVDKERRTTTFSRVINRKLMPKSKSKANGSAGEAQA